MGGFHCRCGHRVRDGNYPSWQNAYIARDPGFGPTHADSTRVTVCDKCGRHYMYKDRADICLVPDTEDDSKLLKAWAMKEFGIGRWGPDDPSQE